MIFAFAGQKGGAGKSTLAVASAAELHRRGHRVLLVDVDPQESAYDWAQAAMNARGGGAPDTIVMRGTLRAQLASVATGYDFVVVDCPGRGDALQRDALLAADVAIVPVTPDSFDAWAIGGSLEMMEGAQQFNESLSIFLALTKLRAGTTEANVAREMFEELGYPILRSEIGFRVAYGRFADAGQGVVGYEPNGKAAKEIKRLASELEDMKRPAIKEVANV